MMIIKFDKIIIEQTFRRAERILLNINNVNFIKYEKSDITTFDKLNVELLKNISGKSIIYCLWLGDNKQNILPKYIGQANKSIARQRIRAHLTKKNKATGSQLEKIKKHIIARKYIGLSYLIIEPSYMRKSLEDWLIHENADKLEWNKNK